MSERDTGIPAGLVGGEQRNLAVAHVLFMDIVGYSRRPTEEQTHNIEELQELVRSTAEFAKATDAKPLVSLPTGDGIALVFLQDPVAPVRCALELAALVQPRTNLPLRMGIHSGPVYQYGDINTNSNIAGGGINIAQRVMDCGDSGHILVSKTVAETLLQLIGWQAKLTDIGEQEVKHGVVVHLFSLQSGSVGNPRLPGKLQATRKKKRQTFALAMGVTLLLIGAAGAGFYLKVLSFGSGNPLRTETMVVLPFENLGADPANQAFCDGLQETVTSILSSAVELKSTLLIVPSSEVRRSQIRTISAARRQFSATMVLTGSTQPGTEDLELTLDLTDARSMRQKNSRILSVPASEKASLQRQLMESLGAMLGARSLLAGGARSAGDITVSSASYDLFLQGAGALADNNLDMAVSLLAKSVEADRGFALARAKLAQAYLRKNIDTKDTKWLALADLEAGKAALAGQSPEVLMSQAMIRQATGDTPEAIALFRRVLKSDPGNVEAFRLLAAALDSSGRSKEAEDTYWQGVRLRPGYWPLYESLGDFYSRRQEYREAERAFSTGLTLAAETPSLYYNLGAMYFRMSDWEDAAKAFEKSLAVRPTALGYANLGTVRFFQGNYSEAARQMELATKLQPANYINWGNLGDALWQLDGKREQARAAFDHAAVLASQHLEINPAEANVRKSYALYLAKLGRTSEAGSEARQAIAQAPKDGLIRFYAARVFEAMGDRDAALSALQQCVALGYSAKEIREEPDFAPLQTDPRYRRIVESGTVSR